MRPDRVGDRSRRRDERGAIAIMAAAVATALFVVAAFAVDFGMAYNSKRQLQTAADAGVLAAAAVYTKYPGTCSTLALNTAYRTEAQTAADKYRLENRPGSTGTTIAVTCNAQGELEVTYATTGSTEKVFGQLAGGGGSTITTSRTASAVVDVPPAVSENVRPYMLCSADVPVGTPGGVVEIKPPGQAHGGSDCAGAEAGGNWWFVDCQTEGGNSNGSMSAEEMGEAIRNGCTNTISIVRPQNSSTSGTLSSSLTANCKTGSPATASCLDGDTGNSSLQNKKAYEAWDDILGKSVIFPVFCTDPTCSPDTVSGTGTNSRYPVYKLAAAVVCGFHIYDNNVKVSATGDCSGNPYTFSYVNAKDKKDVYLYLKFTYVQTSSDLTQAECALSTVCDGGVRRVHLSQ